MNVLWLLVAFTAVKLLTISPRLSPDGHFYLNRPNIMPYKLRGLGSTRFVRFANPIKMWDRINSAAILVTALALEVAFFGAGFLFLGLASTRTNLIFPVLTDQLGIMCLALGFVTGNFIFFVLGGLFNEKVPLIGGFLNPLGFLGLVFPLFAYFKWQEPLKADDPDWLREPLRTGLDKLKQTNPADLIFPWGIAVIGLFLISPIFLLFAYGPLIFVQDRARIYQWISPMVCASAAAVIPPLWFAPLVIIHFMNPWRHVL